jgi:cation:H+ antiporter
MELLINVVLVSVGLAMLYFGAEWLVRGSINIANKFKISQLVIGLTIVAFGTSTPELSVSVSSAMEGLPDVALGNVVGSNIANIGLILGLSAIITPILVTKSTIRKEIPIMIGVALIIVVVSIDGNISTIDGVLLAIGIVAFTIFSYKSSKKDSTEKPLTTNESQINNIQVQQSKVIPKSIALVGIGLVLLTFGSFMTVENAVVLAHSFGISERIIGLTLVAVGTSLPELITSVIAARKGHGDLSIGNIVGSNIFNILAILGISAAIAGISVSDAMWFDYAIMIVFSTALLVVMKTGFRINRIEGLVLISGYIAYTVFLFLK